MALSGTSGFTSSDGTLTFDSVTVISGGGQTAATFFQGDAEPAHVNLAVFHSMVISGAISAVGDTVTITADGGPGTYDFSDYVYTYEGYYTVDVNNTSQGVALVFEDSTNTKDNGDEKYLYVAYTGTENDEDITFTLNTSGIPCFLPGTRIATPSGEIAVEELHEDDLVLTASGEAKPIAWIGYRHVVAAELPNAHLHAPVLIAKDAIAQGKPARDLWVTPDHAILVEGRLIPAKLLVNGTTIRQEPRGEYSFYHLELDQHALLLAEGLEAESYLDVANTRQRFTNHDVTDLALDLSLTDATERAYAERGVMPLTLRPDAVKPVWDRLAARAKAAPAPVAAEVTADPALHLLVDGQAVQPSVIEDGRYLFSLPEGAARVTIASRAASVWESKPWLDDRRTLGVAIAAASVTDGGSFVPLDLTGGEAVSGWHAPEQDAASGRVWRWTDGAAVLALPGAKGKRWLMLTVQGTLDYRLEAAAPLAA